MPEAVIDPAAPELRMILERTDGEARRVRRAVVHRRVRDVHDVGRLEPRRLVAHALGRALGTLRGRRVGDGHLLRHARGPVLRELHVHEHVALLEHVDLALVAVLRVRRGPVPGARVVHDAGRAALHGEALQLGAAHPDLHVPTRRRARDGLGRGDEVVTGQEPVEEVVEQLLVRLLALGGTLLAELLVRVDEEDLPEPRSVDGPVHR